MGISRTADTVAPGQASAAVTVEELTKCYGRFTAVENASFSIRAGAVTGFFGPNGAGKTTVLKVITGLARESAGRVLVNGRAAPVRGTGALGVFIEPCGAHPGRSAHMHLRSLATMAGLPAARVSEVLALVGLERDAHRRVGGYSLGLRQRLGLATALLADPDILVLDEPTNGLDPQGIRWLRNLLRERADSGRTIVVSSHSLAEAELLVDEVVVMHRGRIVTQASMHAITQGGSTLEEVFLGLTSGVDQ
ncbi:ABC transporter ATP-binding protein [Frankia sp. R82]|uniref:ABC transporter ATP-binding protein n=1 Tax=Frankia sp. R82 TaxID=2950553 RepID=UPI0020445D67|nr:ATP-binding cassette domain-containing protein [Frankia sp. R82]MCM3882521.1 ATP-binding cassette domain-containing protein [Frankia sp. R82]